MSFEIDVVSSDLYDPAYACDASEKSATLLETDHIDAHCRAIFNQKRTQMYLNSKSVQILSKSIDDQKKVSKLYSVKGEVTAALDFNWDKSKLDVSIVAQAKCYDDRKNSLNVDFTQHLDGKGNLQISGSYKKSQ